MIIADTDVLIDFLQGKSPAADRVTAELDHGHLATTTITRFELLAGARPGRQQRVILELLTALACLPFDSEAADIAAKIRRDLDRKGHGIGMGDSLIAGVVLARRAVLLTRNVRHFQRVPGLTLGSWTEST